MRITAVAMLSPLLLAFGGIAHAAPVASLACTTNTGTLAFNVSYFEIGAASSTNIGSQGSGAGAGKGTTTPLVVYAALLQFETLFLAAIEGTAYPSCILSTTASNGDNLQFTIKNVLVSSVTAIAGSASAGAPRKAYVTVTLNYSQVSVTDSATGGSATHDGGSPGWDIGKNQSS